MGHVFFCEPDKDNKQAIESWKHRDNDVQELFMQLLIIIILFTDCNHNDPVD